MSRTMERWIVVVVVATVLAVLGAAPAAQAQEPTTVTTALVRVAHLSPDTPGVDVYVDGQMAITNMGFEIISDYVPLPPGAHRVELRPTGAAVTSVAVLDQEVVLDSGTAYTVAGIGPRARLGLRVFRDDLQAPAPGQANVRVIHGEVDAPTVDLVTAAGVPLVVGAAPGDATPYASVAAGSYDLVIQDAATRAAIVSAPAVELGAGITYTVAVVGGAGQPARLLPIVDARAASLAPVGALATGMGGMADASQERSVLPTVGLVLAVAAVVALAVTASTRRRRARFA
jgi:hypothetical protein